jgi:hypothetical protein
VTAGARRAPIEAYSSLVPLADRAARQFFCSTITVRMPCAVASKVSWSVVVL